MLLIQSKDMCSDILFQAERPLSTVMDASVLNTIRIQSSVKLFIKLTSVLQRVLQRCVLSP